MGAPESPRSPVPREPGPMLRRSLGSPALFAIVWSSLAAAVYFSLGIVAENALGLTPVVFLGAGIWHPGSPALKRIRDTLVARPEAWRSALAAVEPVWRLADGESLKRAPAGYSPDHPLIEDIKRKSFAVVSRLTQREVTASGFLDECEARAARARAFMELLSSALGVEY